MLFYPEGVAVFGALVYIVVWLMAPLEVVYSVAWGSLGYVLVCYMAFFWGCALAQLTCDGRARSVPVSVYRGTNFQPFWIFAVLGVCGILLRVYDKYFIRGVDLLDSVLDARNILAGVETSPFAAVGALLYPFCYVPLMVLWADQHASGERRLVKGVAIAIFCLPALDALFLFSRSQMLVAGGMMYFAVAFTRYSGRPFHRRLVLPAVAGMLAGLQGSMLIFATRLDQMQLDIGFSILNSAYGYTLTPSEQVLPILQQSNIVGSTISGLVATLQYYLHGLFEFGLLWERPDTQTFSLGTEHFAPQVKALTVFGFTSTENSNVSGWYFRPGVFTSFFGPVWVDFAWGGPLFLLAFGAICKYCANYARRGDIGVLPLYSYICVVLFFMPVVNFIVSAQGMYIISAFVIFLIVSRFSQSRAGSGSTLELPPDHLVR